MWSHSQRLSEWHQICLRALNDCCLNVNFLCFNFLKLNSHSRVVENKPSKADCHIRQDTPDWFESIPIIMQIILHNFNFTEHFSNSHFHPHRFIMLNSPLLTFTSVTLSGSLLLAEERKMRASVSSKNPNTLIFTMQTKWLDKVQLTSCIMNCEQP